MTPQFRPLGFFDTIEFEALSRIARIVGPSSAAAHALADCEAARAAGKTPVAVRLDGGIVVFDDCPAEAEAGRIALGRLGRDLVVIPISELAA